MKTSRVNYEKLADHYDHGRELSQSSKILWTNLFAQHLGLDKHQRVLDIGCGTGRFAILMASQFHCTVTGIDPSSTMLATARDKCLGMEWVSAQAEALPFSNSAFDVGLISQVIHHFQDKHRAIGEIYRVMRRGARLGIRCSSHAQLATILDYRLFPSALMIDLKRMPDIQEVRTLLQTVGFSIVVEHSIRQQLFKSADDYLEKLRNKYASVLSLISEEEYQEGLKAAISQFQRGTIKTSDKFAEITFLVSVK